MTSLRTTVSRLFGGMVAEAADAPPAEVVLAPQTAADAARVLDFASERRLPVLPWGGGTHQGIGGRVDPGVVLLTSGLDRIVDWQPDDLTVVVESGVGLADLEARLLERGQSVIAAETPGPGTVGGAVAAAASGWRRRRFGPLRERVLEVVLATGDGRVVRAGGRVVKNVTGYDIPRLVTGSLGSLGLIVQVCLKLWPVGRASATVRVAHPDTAREVFRPLAVLEEPSGTTVYLAGPQAQVDADTARLGGDAAPGLRWPDPPAEPLVVSVRVPPAHTAEAVRRLPAPTRYVAAHGVGEVTAGFDRFVAADLSDLRSWTESVGGSSVVLRAPHDVYQEYDPWGRPPPSLDLQRRVKASFDPLRVMVPGRLPGGL